MVARISLKIKVITIDIAATQMYPTIFVIFIVILLESISIKLGTDIIINYIN